MRSLCHTAFFALIATGLAGCFSSSEPLGGQGGEQAQTAGNAATSEEVTIPDNGVEEIDGQWKGYPDLPYVPIEQEVAGVEIPRVYPDTGDYQAGGEVPVDKGNPAAKGKNGEPVTGGSITIRFGAEPKTLNPVTGTDAYQQYIMAYVLDGLAQQDPETFEYEPYMAKKWIVEDSVILRPDYPGHERQVKLGGGKPADSLTIEIKPDPEEPTDPKPVKLTVVDKEGKPVPKSWVGLTSTKPDSGQMNFWTDENGVLETVANGVGAYKVAVGDELYGKLEETEKGLVLTPAAEDGGQEPLTLEESDVINVERGTVFTYYLRDDVTWSDGAPFTVKDLIFAYAVINNPIVDADAIRTYYSNVVDVEELDEHTVRMKYREQYFQAFEFTMALAALAPPWHLFEERVKEEEGRTLTLEPLTEKEEKQQDAWSVHGADFGQFFNTANEYGRKPLGTGPYVVEEWNRQDKQVVLRRRENYWNDEQAGYLDRIIFKFIEDAPTALQALRSGEVDFFYRATADQYFEQLDPPPEWLKKDYVKAAWYSPGYRYVGWNLRKPWFKDRRVRLALSMLFNKKEFFETKLHGAGVMISGNQYYFGPAYDHSVGSVGYDPAAARDLLADAGWIDTNGDGVLDKSGRPFRFTLFMPPGNPMYEARMAIMQQDFRKAGIVMEVELMEWAAFVERLQTRNFDAVTLAWATNLEGDPYQIWHSSGAAEGNRGSNHVGFVNEQADELIEQIQVTLDDEKRKRLNYDFHRLVDREQPYMFLWTPKNFGVYHQKFRGVKFYALRPGFDLREWWIPKELQ